MEENLNKNLESKGYNCNCTCGFHQIKKLGIKEENIPSLRNQKRIGVIKRLAVIDRKTEGKPTERVETEATVFKKRWYESLGAIGEMIVVLEKSEKRINNIEEIKNNLDNIIKFVHRKDEELNEYNKKVILVGIKSLFEEGQISYWDKTVYFLHDVNAAGKSAGIALLIAFYSAYYGKGIPSNFSATGEVNVEDWNIKRIGSLKEKLLCVLWTKETDSLILPKENYEEVLKIWGAYSKRFPTNLKKLKFYPVINWKDLINLLSEWNK